MSFKNILILSLSALILASLILPGCSIFTSGKFRITEIKMAAGIDEHLAPVRASDSFPGGTSSVYCWFSWRNARLDMQLIAKWRYISENINILDYTFTIPRQEGSGSVLLSMPEGKVLPSGSYKIDMVTRNHVVKSCKFKIE